MYLQVSAEVADSSGFYTLKRCARKVLCVDLYSSAISVAAEAVASNKELVCVFPSLEELQWPVEVAVEEIAGDSMRFTYHIYCIL